MRVLFSLAGLLAAGLAIGGTKYVLSGPPAPAVANVAYGANPAQRFDIWKPSGAGPFPVVLTVHGGAFAFGDKRSHDTLKDDIAALLAQGIAVASTNYRMSGEAQFPAAAQDVSAALLELHRAAPTLGLDPDRIALWGKSAGANLALLAGLAAGRPPIGDGRAVRVAGIIAMYPPVRFDLMDAQLRASPCGASSATHGAADSPESVWLGGALANRAELVAQASPLSYIDSAAPPVLVQAGSADCTVPHQQSLMLAAALRTAGSSAELTIIPGAVHIDPVFDESSNLKIVTAFLKRIFKKRTPDSVPSVGGR